MQINLTSQSNMQTRFGEPDAGALKNFLEGHSGIIDVLCDKSGPIKCRVDDKFSLNEAIRSVGAISGHGKLFKITSSEDGAFEINAVYPKSEVKSEVKWVKSSAFGGSGLFYSYPDSGHVCKP